MINTLRFTKCFALSDLRNRVVYNSALPGPEARGQRWVYMIKKKEKESYKRQAASSKQQATLDSWYKII